MINKKKLLFPYIIAEIGSNNNGSILKAKKLIKAAKSAGCDAVKFQSWNENLYNLNTLTNSELSNIKKLVMTPIKLKLLRNFAKKIKIDFGTTVFDELQLKDALKINCDFIKIASMDCNNYPFLKKVLKIKKPVIISTGFTSPKELRKTINISNKSKKKNIFFLHCVSIYPPKYEQLNINNIKYLKKITKKIVGFSDHSIGTYAAILATTAGAKIIEKHFTLNKKAIGADHKISADLVEMKKLVLECKNVSKTLGKFKREISKQEYKISLNMRRSVYAKKNITKNEIFTFNNLCIHRPGDGLGPEYLEKIVSKKAKINIQKGKKISLSMIVN